MRARAGAAAVIVALCLAACATTAQAGEGGRHIVFVPDAATCKVVAEGGKQGWLGVSITDITDEVRKDKGLSGDVNGVLVLEVYDDSPAESAGIEDGDIITTVAGKKAEKVAELVDVISSTEPGTEVAIAVVRGGRPVTVKATLAAREQRKAVWVGDLEGLEGLEGLKGLEGLEGLKALEALEDLEIDLDAPSLALGLSGVSGRGRLGVYINDLSEGLAEHFAVPDGEGVLVEDIVEDSPAEKAGIKPGDVIVRIGDERVSDSEELREAISDMEAGVQTPVVVWRDKKQQTLQVTVEESEYAKAMKIYIEGLGDEEEEAAKVKVLYLGEKEKLEETIGELKEEIKQLKEDLQTLKEKQAQSN